MRDRSKYNAYQREYQRSHWHKRRKELIAALGGRCVICGAIEDLEFDHIDPSSKHNAIADMATASKNKMCVELSKCQLLCKKCHKRKTFHDMGWEFCETRKALQDKKRRQRREYYYRHREEILAKKRAGKKRSDS